MYFLEWFEYKILISFEMWYCSTEIINADIYESIVGIRYQVLEFHFKSNV